MIFDNLIDRVPQLWGRTGFRRGRKALIACRGSQSPRQNGWKNTIANDNVELAVAA